MIFPFCFSVTPLMKLTLCNGRGPLKKINHDTVKQCKASINGPSITVKKHSTMKKHRKIIANYQIAGDCQFPPWKKISLETPSTPAAFLHKNPFPPKKHAR